MLILSVNLSYSLLDECVFAFIYCTFTQFVLVEGGHLGFIPILVNSSPSLHYRHVLTPPS